MDVIVTYDIADTDGSGAKRIRDVASVCEAFGTRAQFSVFECRVSPTALQRLTQELENAIDPTSDSVHIYRLIGQVADCRLSLGVIKHHELDDPWLL